MRPEDCDMVFEQALAVTVLVFVASFFLSAVLTVNYLRTKNGSALFWASGLWLFAFTALEEVLFAAGIYSEFLIDLYLYLVALLVLLLSVGSLLLLKSERLVRIYAIYSVIVNVFLIYALASTTVGNALDNGVVFGMLPMMIIAGSALITFPAAVILIVVAAISYRKRRSWKLISIILGTVIVSVAGTLYIASFPSFLYIAELIGILLLWAGFVDFSSILRLAGVAKHVDG